MLEIRTFGGLTILKNSKRISSFSQRKVPALLVYLAVTRHVYPREILAEFFWEERTTANSLMNLRVALTNLRQVVGNYVTITRDTVSMNLESDFWLDATEFDRLSEESCDVDQLATAIGYYAGGFLDGFSVESREFDLWTTHERERFHLRTTNAFDRLIEHDLQQTNYTTGIEHAMRLLQLEPGREKTHCWLMRLMACLGEREKALEQFDLCCAALSELDLKPSPDTLKLCEEIRAGDYSPATEAGASISGTAQPPAMSQTIPLSQVALSAIVIEKALDIPARAERLIGRDALIDEIHQSLDVGERVLLQGFGGIGKTAVAAEVLASRLTRAKGPALWLNVGHGDADALLEAVLWSLGGDPSCSMQPGAKDQVVRDLLDERNIVLIVCDDVWNGLALEWLINVCPNYISILATSRDRYPVGRIIRVHELALDDALALLSYHAYQLFSPDDPAAVELCERLGCHPLAIEIAGKSMQVDELSPDEILRQIGDAPDTLRDPMRPDDMFPVATLIATSLEGLDRIAQDVFFCFGALFTTTATPELIALCMDLDQEEVNGALSLLNRRGLAERYRNTGDVPVYRVHDLAQAFARAEKTIPTAHTIRACALYATGHADDLAALDAEIDNLIGAAKAAAGAGSESQLVAILRLLAVDAQYFEARGYGRRPLSLLEAAANAASVLGELETAHYLYAKLGNAYSIHLGRFAPAIAAYTQALELARSMQDHTRQAMMLTLLGTTCFRHGDDDPDLYYEQAHRLAAEHDDANAMAFLLSHRSYFAAKKVPPDHERSIQYSDEAITLAKRFGMDHTLWASLLCRASSERPLGRLQSALETDQEALQLARDKNNRVWEAGALCGLGEDHDALGDRDKAQNYLSTALRLYRQNGEDARATRLMKFMEDNNYVIENEDA